jgi:hypothetical protein
MSLVRRVFIDRSRPPPQILSAFDPDGDVCGLCSILIATSARTREGRFPNTRCALFSCVAAHLEARGKATKSQESLLYFQPLELTGRRALGWHRFLGRRPRILLAIPRATREDDRALMLKSMSTADSRPKGAAVPVAHARQVKSLSDRDACVSHPRRLQQL